MSDANEQDDTGKGGRFARLRGRAAAHPLITGLLALLIIGGGVAATQQVRKVVAPPYREVADSVPKAPKLVAGQGERLYRIDATRSEVTYEVGERIVGAEAGTAKGTTRAIAGDIAWNAAQPSASRVGTVVIDVEQLRSDSTLRDARLRSDFLESHQYPLARFTTTSIEGLPDTVIEGQQVDLRLVGQLEVRGKQQPVTFAGKGHLERNELRATMSAKVKMSSFGVGPISIVGLVKTDDEVALTLDLTAADPTKVEIPTRLVTARATEPRAGGPSFSAEVRPILETSCVSCHRKGEIGADVWRLDTAADASQYASGIATVTSNRYMPPWPPSDEGIPLRHARDLPASSIATLARWADHGGRLDVEASTKLEVRTSDGDVPAPRRDLTLRMPEPYAGNGTQTNDYRCFAMDPGFEESTYVTGYSFEPGSRQVVHHALVYRVNGYNAAQVRARDGADGRPGWQCFVGTGDGGRGGELFAGWVPGQRPLDFGEDRGFLFEPGDLVVMQIHYHYSGGVQADRSQLVLETRAPSPTMRMLQVRNPIAPVEMPCPAAQSSNPLCDRQASIDDAIRLYGPAAGGIPMFAAQRCGWDNVTQDRVSGNATGACDERIGTSGHIVDVLGHMHTIGKSFRMTLNPGTPEEKILLDIPTWNFDWQLNYQPVDPVEVHRGDVIRIECSWDRGLRYDPSPKYIVFAEGTEDEMCFSTYTVDPDLRS